MPSASQLYSSGRWLNANDLVSKAGLNTRITAIVHACEPEEIGAQGGEQKVMLMLSLVSKNGQAWPKKVPLNKGNSMQMVAAYGDDYSQWPGKPVQIWAENVMFQGKLVPGIKLASAPNGTSPNVAQSLPQAQAAPASYPPMQPQTPPASPSPSATAVTGGPAVANPGPSWTPPRNANTAPIEDDDIPF